MDTNAAEKEEMKVYGTKEDFSKFVEEVTEYFLNTSKQYYYTSKYYRALYYVEEKRLDDYYIRVKLLDNLNNPVNLLINACDNGSITVGLYLQSSDGMFKHGRSCSISGDSYNDMIHGNGNVWLYFTTSLKNMYLSFFANGAFSGCYSPVFNKLSDVMLLLEQVGSEIEHNLKQYGSHFGTLKESAHKSCSTSYTLRTANCKLSLLASTTLSEYNMHIDVTWSGNDMFIVECYPDGQKFNSSTNVFEFTDFCSEKEFVGTLAKYAVDKIYSYLQDR